MPLLARMIASPLSVEVGHGAVAGLERVLAVGGFSRTGKVAVLVGPGLGEQVADVVTSQLPRADIVPVRGGSVLAAREITASLSSCSYDAVVGVGGGQTLDVAKYAASLMGTPMIAVATSLAHDGLASPVASLEHDGRKSSYGVHTPLAVLVDLDYVLAAPPRQLRSGVGDVVSNLSALADWELAVRECDETFDGLAAAMARCAANSVLDRSDSVSSPAFLTALAEALILSGLAMAVAGSSRPCSGGDHEILHAVNHLYPSVGNHGELAGLGALFCTYLRKDEQAFRATEACLVRHQLPRRPAELGLTDAQFVTAVMHAPRTRPDRFTILESLHLEHGCLEQKVAEYLDHLS